MSRFGLGLRPRLRAISSKAAIPLALSTAVADPVPRLDVADAQMIPMGKIEQALAAAAGAADKAHDIVGPDRLDRGRDLEARPKLERDRPERRAGYCEQAGELGAACAQQAFRGGLRHRSGERRRNLDRKLLLAGIVDPLDHRPGQFLPDDPDHRRGARGRHRLDPFGIRRKAGAVGRVVEDEDDGALEIGSGELVHALVANHRPMAGEDHRRRAQGLALASAVEDHLVPAELHPAAFPALGPPDAGLVAGPPDDHFQGLVPAVARSRRLEPEGPHLPRDIGDRLLLALGPRRAPFEGVACENVDMLS